MRLTYQNVILTIYPPHFSVFSGPRKDSSKNSPLAEFRRACSGDKPLCLFALQAGCHVPEILHS